MGWWERIPIWEEITKEEFDKHSDEDSLLEFLTTGYVKYRREPIYERSGLLSQIDQNNTIIGYKYYKLIKFKTQYLCGRTEYEYLRNKGQLRSNPQLPLIFFILPNLYM